MLDLLLFFWPVSALAERRPRALAPPDEAAAPTRRVAGKSRAPARQCEAQPRGRPALRVLEGGRAGMP